MNFHQPNFEKNKTNEKKKLIGHIIGLKWSQEKYCSIYTWNKVYLKKELLFYQF